MSIGKDFLRLMHTDLAYASGSSGLRMGYVVGSIAAGADRDLLPQVQTTIQSNQSFHLDDYSRFEKTITHRIDSLVTTALKNPNPRQTVTLGLTEIGRGAASALSGSLHADMIEPILFWLAEVDLLPPQNQFADDWGTMALGVAGFIGLVALLKKK